MNAVKIRREVAAITGVAPLSVTADFHGGCRKRALYRVKSDNVEAILACSRRALLCREFVWMLPDEAAELDVVTEALKHLRHCNFVKHGLITFERERARDAHADIQADTHADSPERHEDAIIAD
jgi:hypothetical protein